MKPDFSGEYVLNREASRLSAAVAESVQNASLRIKHDEPKFSCRARSPSSTASPSSGLLSSLRTKGSLPNGPPRLRAALGWSYSVMYDPEWGNDDNVPLRIRRRRAPPTG